MDDSLTVMLGRDVWSPTLAAALVDLGYEVVAMPDDAPHDVIISYYAWRIPASVSPSDLEAYIKDVMRQVRATKRAKEGKHGNTTTKTKKAKRGKASHKAS